MKRPTIGLTMGDPCGVGPEVVVAALSNAALAEELQLIVFGSQAVLDSCAAHLGMSLRCEQMLLAEFRSASDFGGSHLIVDCDYDFTKLTVGKVSAEAGQASFDFIQAAIEAALACKVQAVTTGPINKEALHRAGIRFPGHTEMFAERFATGDWCMMQYSEELVCTFVTVHCGYMEVPRLLTQKGVLGTIKLTHQALARMSGKPPKLAVCGLNPHAGENGLFGNNEEENVIIPAIEQALELGIEVVGPLPPDTAFLPTKRQEFDAVVCMYHDQGHIPLKAIAFDSAVNTTLGLEIVRTSVDHGTAFDIAWQGKASSSSLFSALRLASRLAA